MQKIKQLSITKRQRFLLASASTLVLTIMYPTIQEHIGMATLPLFAITIYFISLIALWENINGVEYLTLFILPVLFSVGINLFLDIVPGRKLFQYPIYVSTLIGMYIILLTQNIFNVAAIRTIQLLRAAHAVSYIMTLISAFLLIAYLISLQLSMTWWIILNIIIIGTLTAQFLWTFDLSETITKRTLLHTAIITITTTQIAYFTQFFPQSIAMTSLFLVAVYYVLLGIIQHHYEKKLSRKPVTEYIVVAGTVFIIMIATTSWLG